MSVNDFELGGRIPPWGRSAAEYAAFFDLNGVPEAFRVLDCAAGPASFAAEWGGRGRFVVAADPAYAQPAENIAAGFPSTAARMLDGMQRAHDRFLWNYYASAEDVVRRRRQALEIFLRDFTSGASRRYVAARLPELPFGTGSFDLALCAHFLFLYSAEVSCDMHVACIREMLRVANEVRIFPLFDMQGEPSVHLEPVIRGARGFARADLVPVPFEFRRGDCRMLRLHRP